MTKRKWLLLTLFLLFIVWIIPATFALTAGNVQGGCQWPYRTWALLWPMFLVLPDQVMEHVVQWSFSLCP